MSALFGLSLIGIFCLIGLVLRRWIRPFRTDLVPALVLAGFLGAIAMNVGLAGVLEGVDHQLFTTLTAVLFTFSFISIGLTPRPPVTANEGGRTQQMLLRGAWAMGITWAFVFTAQALVGVGVVSATGGIGDMDAIYGFMVPFAFAQGPGQAVTFGGIVEQRGWADAVNVALAFASAGFGRLPSERPAREVGDEQGDRLPLGGDLGLRQQGLLPPGGGHRVARHGDHVLRDIDVLETDKDGVSVYRA